MTAIRERPILFSAPMVRAILDGKKTQTRRIVKWPAWVSEKHKILLAAMRPATGLAEYDDGRPVRRFPCPYGVPGDLLWVRETHAQFAVGEGMDRAVPQCVAYRATCADDGSFDYVNGRGEVMGLKITKWTPAIHMPRWASRLALEVVNERVERLRAISLDDIRAEGIDCPEHDGPGGCQASECWYLRNEWRATWDSINGKRAPFDSNPYVWVVEFKRVRP